MSLSSSTARPGSWRLNLPIHRDVPSFMVLLADRFPEVRSVDAETSANHFLHANGAWVGRRLVQGAPLPKGLQDLLDAGMKLLSWDGKYVFCLIHNV